MPKTSVSANPKTLPSLTRRNLLAGTAAVAASALGAPAAASSALPLATKDAALGALEREFEQALAAFWIAHRRYGACETRYFALRDGVRGAAEKKRLKRETGVAAAERAADAAVHALHDLMLRMLHTPARSVADLAMKARVVKEWGQPEWWTDDSEDGDVVAERLAAQVLDAVIELGASASPTDLALARDRNLSWASRLEPTCLARFARTSG